MRTFLLYCFFAALLPACRQPVADTYTPAHSSAQLLDGLLQTGEDSLKLAAFFARWNEAVPPNNEAFIRQNDTIEAIYGVYSAFCLDSTIRQQKRGWHYRARHSNCFLAHPGVLYYKVSALPDSISGNLNIRDSLTAFRPPIAQYVKRNLYLTAALREALNTYSGWNDPQIKRVMFIPPKDTALAQKWARYEQRRQALRQVMVWHSNPELDLLALSGNLQIAHLHLGYMGSGSYLRFIHQNGRWHYRGQYDTWIE